MSTTEIRDDGTDNYIVLSQYDASSNLEVAIAQALVQSAFAKTTINTLNTTYTSPANDSSWNLVSMNSVYPDYINTSAISNYPNGTLPEYSVISSELTTDISLNSYTTNISSGLCANNTYTFQSLPTTSSYYDSNYVFTQNLIADCSDNQTGTYVNATFDTVGGTSTQLTTKKTQYAMQSRWNTTLGPYNGLQTIGPDPTAITQDVSFNTDSAFAQYGSGATDASYESFWFSVDVSNGSLTPNIVDASYQPIFNNLLVSDRNMTGVTLNVNNDVGIFRIQQAANTPDTTVSLNNGSFSTINTNDLNNMPLFNGNGQNPLVYNSSKNSLPIPGVMTSARFQSLFDVDVYNTVADNWTFQIDVSTNNNSGYNIDVLHPLISDLDNSNLLDNPYYMQNYVSNDHSITFSNSSITIDASTNGTSTDATSITIDLTNGETLPQGYAGVDGEIIINTNTIYTRDTDLSSVNLTGDFTPLVAYSGDVGFNPTLSDDEMTNPYFKGMWQKVAQQSSVTSPDYWLKTDASAIMTLYTEGAGIVDNLYSASDFDFSFNNTFAPSTDIQLWQINSTNNIIINPDSFYIDASYTIPEIGIATAGLLTGITDFNAFTYNGYRVLLTAKTKEDIGLYNAVTDVSGWTLSYSNILDDFLHSSANQAYSKSSFPIYDQSVISALDGGANLDFSYTYKTIVDASSAGGLVDYVDISYNSNVVTIEQTDITRNYDATYTNVSISVVPDASYSFTSSAFNKDSFELVYVIANSRYNASFFANYGPFTNIRLTVSNILQNDKFYAVRNITTQKLSPHSVLIYVSAPDIQDLNNIDETITPSSGNSLSINGTFTANDLKPFYSITQGENPDFTWTNIGESIDTDVYYGLENNEPVLNTATLITTIQYTPFSNSVNQSILVNLNLLNYYIPFVYDQLNNAFSLNYFTSSPSTLAANTTIDSPSFLGNTNYLTLTNGYANVTWLNNQYTLTLTHTATTITFTVKNSSDVTQFTITLLNNTVFLGTFFVSYIPQDYYRVERLLGQDANNNTYSESFISTNYAAGNVNLTPTLQGVYIGTDVPTPLTPTICPQLGSYQSFRVLGDYMDINEVGPATPPTSSSELGISSYNSGSLTFQFNGMTPSGPTYSAAFTFPKYRGYKSYAISNPDEYYVINRDATSVTFDVAGSDALSDTLTSNMYYNEAFSVDSLNFGPTLVANLGVTGSFYYSIPPTGYTLMYPVTVTGDNINVSINNPNYAGDASNILVPTGATPVVDPKLYLDSMTLKDYGQNDMYTFSGNWQPTNTLMAIRPSRVKLNNTAYPNNELSYKIVLNTSIVRLYKALNISSGIDFNWLGNPVIKGAQDPDIVPDADDWSLVYSLPVEELTDTGINIGKKNIRQNPSLVASLKLVYIVSAPPYYKFEQTSTNSCPVIPYNATTQYLSNKTQIFMPYISTVNGSLRNTFNPFAPSTTYTDINGNNTSVQNNANFLNNVTFNLLSAPSITAAEMTPVSTRYGIIVPGTNLTVSLYRGLYNNTDSGNHTNPIWTGPITSIPSTPDINNNALILRGRDASGSISFSALQYPADIGFPVGVDGYEEIFATDVSSSWYNIDFNMGNSAWFNNNSPITYFDTQANGVKPTLYTVVDINNPLNQINKRRVYKYTTLSTIDIDISSGLVNGYETFNITFELRSYHDFDISKNNVFPAASGSIWKYNDLLNNTVIPNSSISWTLDASYSDMAYISWAFGNSTTAKNMLIQLFGVQNDQQKWTYIQLEPFMRYLNQFNMQVGSVAWDGTVTAPLVNTRVVKLAPSLTNPTLLNNTYATQQYSESTL